MWVDCSDGSDDVMMAMVVMMTMVMVMVMDMVMMMAIVMVMVIAMMRWEARRWSWPW